MDWGICRYICELTGVLASKRLDSPYTDYLEKKGSLDVHRNYIEEYQKNNYRGIAKPWEEPPTPLLTEDHFDSFTGQTAVDWIKNYHEK